MNDLERQVGGTCTSISCSLDEVMEVSGGADDLVDFETFLKVLNRPDGWKPAGTAGK